MSTLAACRADNFYHPNNEEELLEKRKKEIEEKRRNGTLKLRKFGARKVRFEMPFHVRCVKCKKMIAKGVRFNSIKKKSGRYLGTIIYQFDMKCPNCKNEMTIKTDPKNCEYLLVKGLVKYEVDYEDKSIGVPKIQTPEEGEKMNKNAFYKIETQKEDIDNFQALVPTLESLVELQKRHENYYENNLAMQELVRKEVEEIEEKKEKSRAKGVNYEIFDINSQDREKAARANFKRKNGHFKIRDSIKYTSLLPTGSKSKEKTLLRKKHKLDIGLQLAIEKVKSKKKEMIKQNEGKIHSLFNLKVPTKIVIKKVNN